MVFNKIWFTVNQKEVLTLVNNSPFSFMLKKKLRISNRLEITEMYPTHFSIGNQTHFYSKNVCSNLLYHTFKYYWNLKHYWDVLIANRYAPYLNLGFDTLTAYPDADPETDTFDGRLSKDDNDYSTVRNATACSYPDSTNATIFSQNTLEFGSYKITRAITLFDTSSIGTNIISSATLGLYISSIVEDDSGQSTIHIVSSNPASNTSVTANDYSTLGSTSYGSLAYSSMSTSSYNTITLNSSGLSAISKTGITKLGQRLDGDLNNNTPTGYNNVQYNSADGTYAPKLIVNHTAPPPASNNIIGMV